jgi:hypothetical protein
VTRSDTDVVATRHKRISRHADLASPRRESRTLAYSDDSAISTMPSLPRCSDDALHPGRAFFLRKSYRFPAGAW